MTIKDAAAFVGVSPITLRRWDNAGKLKAHRNPMNRYRLYTRKELETLLRKINRTAQARKRTRSSKRR
jgi:DNA-binding transcriptional MerR regulator